MRPTFDERDREILEARQASYNALGGPRVGDWVEMPNGEMRRFTYDWGDSLQTTCGDGECGSFYLGNGYVSYSGSLDPGIARHLLRDTGRTHLGRVWFFHRDWHMAHNGVGCEIAFRVFAVVG